MDFREKLSGFYKDVIRKETETEKLLKVLEAELANLTELVSNLSETSRNIRLNAIDETWANQDHNPAGHLANMAGPGADRKINPRAYIFRAIKKIYAELNKFSQNPANESHQVELENLLEKNSKMFFLSEYLEQLNQAITHLKQNSEPKQGK